MDALLELVVFSPLGILGLAGLAQLLVCREVVVKVAGLEQLVLDLA